MNHRIRAIFSPISLLITSVKCELCYVDSHWFYAPWILDIPKLTAIIFLNMVWVLIWFWLNMIFLINNILYLCYASMNVCVFLPCRLKDVGKWLASYVYSRNKWQKLVCHPQQELLEAMILIWTTWRLLYIAILIFFFFQMSLKLLMSYIEINLCVCASLRVGVRSNLENLKLSC